MAPLRFACPKCKTANQASDDDAGEVIGCAKCGQKMRVPAGKKAPVSRRDDEEDQLDVLEEVDESPRRGRDDNGDDRPARRRGADRDDDPEDDDEDRPVRRQSSARDDEPEDDDEERDANPTRIADLGPVIREYEASLVWPIIGIAACCLAILFGLLFPIVAIVTGAFPLICASGLLLPLGGLGIWWCYRNIGHKVILHEAGFVQVRQGVKTAVAFEEFEEIFQQVTEHYTNGMYTGTTYVYTVKKRDGRKFHFTNNNLKRVEKLGEALLHEAAQVIFPRKMQTFERGGVARFGKLGVSKEGLSSGSSLLDWDEVDAVEVKAGYIRVSKRGKWFNWCNIPVSTVPNLYVFLSLVNQIVGVDD